MNTPRVIFKWTGITFIFATMMSFSFLLPSVYAQGETPTPSPEITPEPLGIPEIEQGYGAQSLSQPQASAELGGDWGAQVNISNTIGESLKPKIAADNNGTLHVGWRETVGGKQEIYYVQIDGLTQSMPINVSSSPSFNSDSPQLVVDSAGRAHIVWQEEDNDQPDDFETLYSRCDETGCTSPTTLSDGQACGSFVGDWKATDPSISINGNDNLMVAWMSFEPNPRLYTMYSLWSASGSPPSNRTGCNLATGSYYYPVVAGDSNGDFHLLRMNASNSIFYSKYSGGNWSANQTIGTGWLPVIHVDAGNKIHAAWWNTNAPPNYRSKESAGSTWSGTENVFTSTICSNLSLITDGDNLPRLACATDVIYEASRQASGWTESVIVPSMATQPDLAKDVSGSLHLVWSDSSSGNWEIFYSSLIYCSGTTLFTIAQAVFAEVDPLMMYCGNSYDGLITLPPGEEAFQRFGDMARDARYEVDFTTMIWDPDKDPNNPLESPGELFLQGVKQLYEQVKNPVGAGKPADYYADGVHVRILIGIEFYGGPSFDQGRTVMEDLIRLEIPRDKPEYNWSVEVATINDIGTHSHVKTMIVDGKHVIVGGYNVDDDFISRLYRK